jgi:predicted membrane channel-forming protein YqfA (hemolysin III family)
MTTATKSKTMLSVLIVAAMLPGCYLLTERAYMLYGLILVIGGLALLGWLWKPWQRPNKSR